MAFLREGLSLLCFGEEALFRLWRLSLALGFPDFRRHSKFLLSISGHLLYICKTFIVIMLFTFQTSLLSLLSCLHSCLKLRHLLLDAHHFLLLLHPAQSSFANPLQFQLILALALFSFRFLSISLLDLVLLPPRHFGSLFGPLLFLRSALLLFLFRPQTHYLLLLLPCGLLCSSAPFLLLLLLFLPLALSVFSLGS